MKKLAILFLSAALLAGCGKKEEAAVYRVVTGVEVEFYRQGEILQRTYSQTASVESVLTYLRILRPFGPTIPQGDFDSGCRITLHYSDGGDSVYEQMGNKYLCRDGGDWQNIESASANLLYPLLLLLPSDA